MTEQNLFRFGVVAAQATSGEDWIAKVRRIESMGYSTLLMPDGLRYVWSPLPALAAAAAATRDLRVGTYVAVNGFRNPVQLAKDAATVDIVSGGRFELGLGAGRPTADEDARMQGLSFEAASVRVQQLSQSLELIKAVLSGETVTATGPHYSVQDAEISPLPAQQPRPPVLIAGWGRRMLLLAAQHADIVALSMPPFAPVANVAERISWLRAAAGSRFTRLELNINLMAVGDRVATWIAHRMGLSANDLAQSATALLGTVDQMCETLRRRRESLGISYIVVGEEFMDVLAPVVEQLAGH